MHFFSCPDYSYTTENENGWKHLFYRDAIHKEKCFDEMEILKTYIYGYASLRLAEVLHVGPHFLSKEKTTSTLEIHRLLLHEFCPGFSFVFSPCAFHLKKMIAIWF